MNTGLIEKQTNLSAQQDLSIPLPIISARILARKLKSFFYSSLWVPFFISSAQLPKFIQNSHCTEERQDTIQWCLDLLGPISFSWNFLFTSPKESINNSNIVFAIIFNMLWTQIKDISPLNFSVLWRGSGDLLCHSGTCQLFRIVDSNSQISSLHHFLQTISCTAPVRKCCNAQYPVFCSYFAFLLPFLTGHRAFYIFCQPTTFFVLSVLSCLSISLLLNSSAHFPWSS